MSVWLVASWSTAIRAQSPAGPPLCRAVQLEPFFDDNSCGMGRCYPAIDFRNVSATACTLPADISVMALDQHGGIIQRERPGAENGPFVLEPGDFGEYDSVTYSGDKDLFPNPPPFADTYLFRFSPDDPDTLRVPGAQGFEEGLRALFDKNSPPPDLSRFPRQTSGKFAFSAFPWPQTDPDPHRVFDLYSNPFVELHVSVSNHGAFANAEWNACHVLIDASEVLRAIGSAPKPTAHISKRSVYPCGWNGDISHGAIAGGATVAFEVAAKLPEVCHLARYKISVSLENAPVKFTPLNLYTDELQPSCDDSRMISSSLPTLSIPPVLNQRGAKFGLPVHGIKVGLEVPTRFNDSRGIGVVFPGDPVIADVWIENGRDTSLHFAGSNGFFIHVVSYVPTAEPSRHSPGSGDFPAVGLVPRVGSKHTGPIDVIIPPHTAMRVANINLGAQYDFPVGPVPYQESVYLYPEALTGEDAKWNYSYDYDNAYALKTVAGFHVESHDAAK
ncbi:MAG: hypothetical protein WB679_26490 [Terracidiphilus sp.]